MRRVLDLFREQGTVDEMGLGTVRDALSNVLFPGITSIQTRLRYVLFIPWIYQRLEERGIPADRITDEARQGEIALIEPLANSADNEGVFGRFSGASLQRLPSSVYWGLLRRLGMFQHRGSQSWYHSRFASLYRSTGGVERPDDPGVDHQAASNWHPRLVELRPTEFPSEISFALTRDEADFIQSRIMESCSGTLLAWLVSRSRDTPAQNFWEDSDALAAGDKVAKTVELARRFSLHVEGMPLLYNLLLAERLAKLVKEPKEEVSVDTYRAFWSEWAGREASENVYDLKPLLSVVGGLAQRQREFIEGWTARLAVVGVREAVDDPQLRRLIVAREHTLKKARARIANTKRLLVWQGNSGTGRMDFNWFRVRRMLIDLRQGFAS